MKLAVERLYKPAGEAGEYSDAQLDRARDMLVSGIHIPKDMIMALAERHAKEQAPKAEVEGHPPPSAE